MADAVGNKAAHDYHLDTPPIDTGFFAKGLGNTDWGALEIEIIAGREESLLLARPASGVYISREALSRLASHGR